MAGAATAHRTSIDTFLRSLAAAPQRVLLLDYDGTLAPFREERDEAKPYPEIPGLLDQIGLLPNTVVSVVSGRPARDVAALLGMHQPVEIWGSHGMERLMPTGEYQLHKLSARPIEDLNQAAAQLADAGLHDRVESKPGAVAVHWRGLDPHDVQQIHVTARRIMNAVALRAGLLLSSFDGGIELRVRNPNKGDVVQALLKNNPESRIAYLGDDMTDEDAFRALASYGLTVLVRDEYRTTAAQAWIRPPDELRKFLRNWLSACGGTNEQE
ncbi:MAG TPA: trehalose-phosphatase [Terriglobales bacterium]|nr:trehalose-phosphatase [Terriglobales bacterium]